MATRQFKIWQWALIVFVMACLQALYLRDVLDLPPLGQHLWRQVTGMAFARNFAFDGATFFLPRQDIRVSGSDLGIIYHEFPLIYWIVGKAWQTYGYDPMIARVIALLFNVTGIAGSLIFARALYPAGARAVLFCILYSFAPLNFYYATTLLPDLFAMHCYILGAGLLLWSRKKDSFGWLYVGGLAALTLALVTKASWAFFGLPIVWILMEPELRKKRMPTARTLTAIGLGSFAVAFAFASQIFYSQKLHKLAPLERAAHAQLKIAEFPESAHDLWRNFSAGFGNWFMEMNVGFAALPLFLVGLWLVLKSWRKRDFTRVFWLAFGFGFAVYATLFFMRLGDHDYYMTPSLPLAAALSSLGGVWLLERHRILRMVALVLIALYPSLSWKRVEGRFQQPQVPLPLFEHAPDFTALIPAQDGVLVVGDKTPLAYLYYLDRKGMVYMPDVAGDVRARIADPYFQWVLINRKVYREIPRDITETRAVTSVKVLDEIELLKLGPLASEGVQP